MGATHASFYVKRLSFVVIFAVNHVMRQKNAIRAKKIVGYAASIVNAQKNVKNW
jgi:hypothetical protein